MRARLVPLLLSTASLLLAGCSTLGRERPGGVASEGNGCVPVARWVDPATGNVIGTPEVVERFGGERVVLLGEKHDRVEHHRWQLYVTAALQARRRPLVLAFEAFPRRVQPVLDRWVAGELAEPEFLREVGWSETWAFPPALYLPLFHFARLNRTPMRALNVERSLISKVAEKGWANVAPEEREGLSDPAPAAEAYERALAEVYGEHADEHDDGGARARFVEAQLVWDRAFAEGIAAAARRSPGARIVGIIGRGHLENGYGVPHQLAALGIDDVAVLLPWDPEEDCAALTADLADAVFGVPAAADEPAPPRLGVGIAKGHGGVAVVDIVGGSVAEAAGIRNGDTIVAAAGFEVRSPGELKQIVARQAPGTWLPLRVLRDGEERDVVAKFPGGAADRE